MFLLPYGILDRLASLLTHVAGAPQDFVQNKSGYLQTQVGNPEGADKPNKKVMPLLGYRCG